MRSGDFIKKLEEHPDLEWSFVVQHKKGTNPVHGVKLKAVKEYSWKELEGVLTEKREIKVLDGYARICGYFSRVSSWNRSKLGEQEARRKGNYKIEESGDGNSSNQR